MKTVSLRTLGFCSSLLFAFALPAQGPQQPVVQEELKSNERTNGYLTTKALESRLDKAREITVRFQEGRNRTNLAIGTVVSPDGWILAKLSDLENIKKLYAVLTDDSRVLAVIKARDEVNDLALLKVEAAGLAHATFDAKAEIPPMGTMLYAFKQGRSNFRMGVVSALPREVKKPGGVMGILMGMGDEEGGVLIDEVVPESGADAGGLKAGDVILSVNGQKVSGRKDVTKLVGSHAGGETVELTIRRGEEEKNVKVTLADRAKLFGQEEKEENPFNGRVSERRIGFSRIIQHDINLEPAAMGGPLWDLDGKLVGLNIARVERVATFALPSSLVKECLDKLQAQAKKDEEEASKSSK